MDMNLAAQLAPRDPRRQGAYWRDRCNDASIAVGQLQAKITRLERELATAKADRDYVLQRSVTVTVAEEERRRAAAGMRERAACLVEGPDDEPTAASEAIRGLPDPKPKWSRRH
jgi:hypothetical protein